MPWKRQSVLVAAALAWGLAGSAILHATQTFTINTQSWTDSNHNDLIDCGEAVRVEAVVYDGPVSTATRTGHLIVPSSFPANFRYTGWAQDFSFTSRCRVVGDESTAGKVELDYSCEPGTPPNDSYVFSILLDGVYVGPTNFLTFTGTDTITAPASEVATLTASYNESRVKSCAQPDLQLAKSDGGISSAPGQTIPYTLAVVNRGSSSSTGTTLTETVPANTTFNATASSSGWTCVAVSAGSTCTLNLGTLVLGGSASRVFAVDVGVNLPAGTTQISNTASVSSFSTDANPADNTATDTTPLAAGAPDLTLTKTASSTGATPGSILTWTLAVANRGTAAAANVTIHETLPAGTTFNAAGSSAGWTCSGPSCSLTLGTVNAGTSTSKNFSARVTSPASSSMTTIANTACAATTTTGDSTGNNCGSTSTPLGGEPRLQLAKTVSSGNGAPGSVIVWRLTVTNTGDRDAATVIVHETVPANTTFDSAGSSPGWSCAGTSAGSSCTATLGTLAGAGATAALNFATRVVSPLPAGITSVANSACATTAGAPDACGSTEQPTDGSAHLALVKRLVSGNGAPGSVLRYALDIQNTGDQATTNVVLQETVPANTTFLPAQSPGWSCSDPSPGSACSLTIAAIAGGGAIESRDFAVQVANPLAAGITSIANTACIVGGPVGAFHARGPKRSTKAAAASDACSTIVVSPAAAPVLTISKTLTDGPAVAGSTVVYSITVSNTGNQDAAALTLVDTIPAGSRFAPPPASPAGWTCSPTQIPPSTCTLSLGSLAAGASASRTLAFLLDNPQPAGQATLVNQACVSDGSRKACASTNDPVFSSTNPALTLTKSYEGAALTPGALLSFHLLVSNSGNANANGVRLRETIPSGATFVAASSDAGWSCSSASCTLALDPLGPGQSRDIVFALRAANPLPSGVTQIANVACLEDTAGSPIDCDQVSTPLPVQVLATLSDAFTYDSNHNDALNTGDVVRYTLVVRNPTTTAAIDLVISTTLDPRLTLVVGSVTSSAGAIAAGTPPTVRLASLAPDAAVTITFDAIAGQLVDLAQVASQAHVTGSNIGDTPSDDPDTPEALDPTRTPVANGPLAPAPIPTLGEVGLAVLFASILGAAVCVLRRRRTS